MSADRGAPNHRGAPDDRGAEQRGGESEIRRQVDARAERVLGPQRVVTITDARAMRALAHEARQRVIEVLYAEQRPRTATELAARTGLSPSAMSYHLRALEKWGVVERSSDEGDARNRPWKASGTSLRIDSSEVGPAVGDLMADQLLAALTRRLRAHRERPPEKRAGSVALSAGELWLTPEQADRLSVSLDNALLDEHEAGWRNEPGPGRVRMAFLWSLLPDPLPGDEDRQAGAS
jgi:DNA-binding transcriptional ArsR family regulator